MADGEMPEGFGPDDDTAHERAETDTTRVTFLLKESEGGPPWLRVEEDLPGLPILRRSDAFLGLRCRPGTTIEQAEALRRHMHEIIEEMSYTAFLT